MAVVIFRLEGGDGIFRAYQINVENGVAAVASAFSEFYPDAPKPIRTAVDSFLFAMRHGPIQAMFKSHECSPAVIQGLDKNTQTVAHLAQLYFIAMMSKSKDPDSGEFVPIDVPAGQMSFLMGNIIERASQYDREIHGLPEPEEARTISE